MKFMKIKNLKMKIVIKFNSKHQHLTQIQILLKTKLASRWTS